MVVLDVPRDPARAVIISDVNPLCRHSPTAVTHFARLRGLVRRGPLFADSPVHTIRRPFGIRERESDTHGWDQKRTFNGYCPRSKQIYSLGFSVTNKFVTTWAVFLISLDAPRQLTLTSSVCHSAISYGRQIWIKHFSFLSVADIQN